MRATFKFDTETQKFAKFKFYDINRDVTQTVYISTNALIPSVVKEGATLELIVPDEVIGRK